MLVLVLFSFSMILSINPTLGSNQCFSSSMNVIGCGTDNLNCGGDPFTWMVIVFPLTQYYGYVGLGGSDSYSVVDKSGLNDTCLFIIKDNSWYLMFQMVNNKVIGKWVMMFMKLIRSTSGSQIRLTSCLFIRCLLLLIQFLSKIWALTFSPDVYMISAGIISDETQISFASFNAAHPKFAIIITFNISEVGSFQLPGKIFYSSQNGFEIFFLTFTFSGIGKGVLAGRFDGGTLGLYYRFYQGIAIDIPEPYYFTMGTPQLVDIQSISQSVGQVIETNKQISYNRTIFFIEGIQQGLKPLNEISMNITQPIIQINRSISIPEFNISYDYILGDVACFQVYSIYKIFARLVIQQIIGKSLQSCVQMQYIGRLLKFLAFLSKCFMGWKEFGPTLKLNKLYQQQFNKLQQQQSKYSAGRSATLTLPEYYDPNPYDTVSVKFETPERYRQYFRLVNQDTIVFDAGFQELGDKQLIITLRDNNPTDPKESKYLITATFKQNDRSQMENDNVNKVNLTNTSQSIYAFASNKAIYVEKITPNGQISINFEKSLNISNVTYAQELIKRALKLEFQDSNIKFKWEIVFG
eukprot:403361194